MNVTALFAVFDFGSGVKGRMSFRSPVTRRQTMEAAASGCGEEADYTVLASDGVRRKIRTALAGYAVDGVTR